ncbi:hypothetical protein [Streptosporangium sp. KLBMP 9127]|nr:hypothetical protein [Streptosporangium sp. KLBMP 9127]
MTELLVNTTTIRTQMQPAVAPMQGTRFFVAWADSSDATIKGRVVRANGPVSGQEFIVNKPTPVGSNITRKMPAVNIAGSGPVVVWIESAVNPPGPLPHVKLQRFNTSADKVGPETQVSTTDIDPKNRPSVTNMIDGGFLVTWTDARQDKRIRAQRFGFDGTKTGSEFTVNTTQGFHQEPLVRRLVNGNYVVVWRSDPDPPGGGRLTLRIFDLQGSPVTGEVTPNLSGFGGQKALNLLDNGRFVIAHVRALGTSGIGVSRSNVEWRVYEPGGAFANISLFASDAQGINCSAPALAPLPSGRFLVAWVEKSAETFATVPHVKAKIFSDSQGAVGQEVRASESPAEVRSGTAAATAFGEGEGEFAIVTWHDDSESGGDTSEFGVRGRVYRVVGQGQLT